MSHEILTSIFIRRPPAEVFSFVTTAENWARWHPVTVSVEGGGRSGKPGDKILEKIRFGPMRGEIRWVVRESDPPRKWVIEGEIFAPFAKGMKAAITYRLTPRGEGTDFERRMIYAPEGALASFLDKLFALKRNRSQSQQALRNLKQVLENRP